MDVLLKKAAIDFENFYNNENVDFSFNLLSSNESVDEKKNISFLLYGFEEPIFFETNYINQDFPIINLNYYTDISGNKIINIIDISKKINVFYTINKKINEEENFKQFFKKFKCDECNMEIYKKSIIFSFFLLFKITKNVKKKKYLKWNKLELKLSLNISSYIYSIPKVLIDKINKKIENSLKELEIEEENKKRLEIEEENKKRLEKEEENKKRLEIEEENRRKLEIEEKNRKKDNSNSEKKEVNYKIHIFLLLVLLVFLIIFLKNKYF